MMKSEDSLREVESNGKASDNRSDSQGASSSAVITTADEGGLESDFVPHEPSALDLPGLEVHEETIEPRSANETPVPEATQEAHGSCEDRRSVLIPTSESESTDQAVASATSDPESGLGDGADQRQVTGPTNESPDRTVTSTEQDSDGIEEYSDADGVVTFDNGDDEDTAAELSAALSEEEHESAPKDAHQEPNREPDRPTQHGSVVSSGSSTVGRDMITAGIYNEASNNNRDGFLPLARGEWEVLERQFVPSASCREFTLATERERLVVVLGDEHAGKRSTSLFLANQFGFLGKDHLDVLVYRPAGDDYQVSLHDLLRHRDLRPGSFLLFEDAFEIGISPTEIKSLQSLQPELTRRNCFLVLTSELDPKDLPQEVPHVSATLSSSELLRVFEQLVKVEVPKQLAADIEVASVLIRRDWDNLAKVLDAPYKIQRFHRCLIEHFREASEIDQTQLLWLVHESVDPGPSVLTTWFQGLGRNSQLLAFLIVFFDDLPKPELISLFWDTVSRLRKSEIALFDDPRQQGLEDSIEMLQARTRSGLVRMESTHHIREVINQVGNHVLVLRSAVESMLSHFKSLRGSRDWPLRKGLGALIGHVGFFDWEWLIATIDRLARDDGWQCRTLASYAVMPIIELDLRQKTTRSLDLVRAWCQADDLNLRWTAGAALWQVYQKLSAAVGSVAYQTRSTEMKAEFLGLLRSLATHKWGGVTQSAAFSTVERQVPGATRAQIRRDAAGLLRRWRGERCLFPLTHILRTYPEDASKTLATWMSSSKDCRDFVIAATCDVLGTPSFRQLAALPHLLAGVVDSAASIGQKSQVVFEALRGWLSRIDLQDGVVQALMDVADRGGSRQRSRLRQALARSWWTPRDARKVARQIVARTWILDGHIGASRTDISTLIIAEHGVCTNGNGKTVLRYLDMTLSSVSRLLLARLGDDSFDADEDLRKMESSSAGTLPNLFLPVMEKAEQLGPLVTVVLAARRIVDFEDILALSHGRSIIVFDLGDAVQRSLSNPMLPSVSIVHLKQTVSERTFEVIDRAIALALWSASRTDTRDKLASSVHEETDVDLASVQTLVELEVAQSEDASEYRLDTARLGLARDAFLSLCNREPERATEIVWDWLSQDWDTEKVDSLLEDRLTSLDTASSQASCLARVLLLWSVHFHSGFDQGIAQGLFETIVPQLLELSPQDEPFVVSILESWLSDPSWNDYLAGDATGNGGRLLRFLEDRIPQQLSRFQHMVAHSGHPFAMHLQHRLGQGNDVLSFVPLSPLEEGKSRGVVVVDNTQPSFWEVAHQFVEQLERSAAKRGIDLSLFQLGYSEPVRNPGSGWFKKISADQPSRSLGPILENPSLRPEETLFVLVLCGERCLDQSDWRGPPWAQKIVLCSRSSGLHGDPTFATIEAEGWGRAKELATYLAQVVDPWLPLASSQG